MAVSNLYIYCGEGGTSVDGVNRLSDSLSKRRIWESHDGIELAELTVLTNEDPSLFYKEVTVQALEHEYENPYWNFIECLNVSSSLHGEEKVVLLQGELFAQDLISIPTLETTPEKGSVLHAAKPIEGEDADNVRENGLYPIQQFDNWWNDETEYSPFYMGIPASTARDIYKKFLHDKDNIIADYDPTPYGFQQWIECDLEPELFWLQHPHGIMSPYPVNDWDTREELNKLWDENVRPHFNPPLDGYGWRGLGGDEEAKLFESDHEYQTLSRQVSWLILEGDVDNVLEDSWFRWWIY